MAKPHCPRCGQPAVRIHCDSDSSDCTWIRCGNCSLTFDLITQRAFDPKGTVTLTE